MFTKGTSHITHLLLCLVTLLALCGACGPKGGTQHGSNGNGPPGNGYHQINTRNDILDSCVQQISEKHTMEEFCTTDLCPSKECGNLCNFIRRTSCKNNLNQ